MREQFKAWCTRKLKEQQRSRQEAGSGATRVRKSWWAERGSDRCIGNELSLEAAIQYVLEGQ